MAGLGSLGPTQYALRREPGRWTLSSGCNSHNRKSTVFFVVRLVGCFFKAGRSQRSQRYTGQESSIRSIARCIMYALGPLDAML